MRPKVCHYRPMLLRKLTTLILLLLMPCFAKASGLVLLFDGFELEAGRVLYLQLHRVTDMSRAWRAPVVGEYKVESPLPKTLELTGLVGGRYAMRGYVDINGNGELDLDERNRPSEPFGFTFDLKRRKPSLSFKRAVFELAEERVVGFSILAAPGCKSKVADCAVD